MSFDPTRTPPPNQRLGASKPWLAPLVATIVAALVIIGISIWLTRGGASVVGADAVPTAAPAPADARVTTGVLATVDNERGTVTLDNGANFAIGENVERDILRPGVRVTVTWENQNDRPVALKVAPAL